MKELALNPKMALFHSTHHNKLMILKFKFFLLTAIFSRYIEAENV